VRWETETDGGPPAGPSLLLSRFAAIYVLWGSTYLAIRAGGRLTPPAVPHGRYAVPWFEGARPCTAFSARGGAPKADSPTLAERGRFASVPRCFVIGNGGGDVGRIRLTVPSGGRRVGELVIATLPALASSSGLGVRAVGKGPRAGGTPRDRPFGSSAGWVAVLYCCPRPGGVNPVRGLLRAARRR